MTRTIACAVFVCFLVLCDSVYGQGILEQQLKKIDELGTAVKELGSKLQSILDKLSTSSPPPTVPPPVPCATKLCSGDIVQVLDNLNVRQQPDLSSQATVVNKGTQGKVVSIGASLGDGRTWVQVSYPSVTGWSTDSPLCKVPCAAIPPSVPPSTPPVVPPPAPPLVPPPPPSPPVSGGTYYISLNGDDSYPGTVEKPFRSFRKALPLLKPGEVLVVRGGEYDTGAGFIENGNSLIPSGDSWEKPITIRAYPGEKPLFRRFLPANYPHTEDEVRNSIHLPTYEECAVYASYGLVKDFPYSCWQGSGNNQPAGGLYYQTPKGFIQGWVINLLENGNRVQYVVIDGIDIDAKGIVASPIGFSELVKHVRLQNLEIRYGIGSCMNQSIPASMAKDHFDIQFFRVKIHSCGVPFDKNVLPNGQLARKSQWARYWHGAYAHGGGLSFIESESYNHAGTGLGPEGDANVIKNSKIHSNSAHGIYIAGGNNWLIEGNIFEGNTGAEVYHYNGMGHTIAKNTIIAGRGEGKFGIYVHLAGQGSVYRDNIIDGFERGIYNTQCGPSLPCFYKIQNTAKNNLIRTRQSGYEITNANDAVPLIDGGGNLKGLDPRLDANYVPTPASPAVGKASDGSNIGAK